MTLKKLNLVLQYFHNIWTIFAKYLDNIWKVFQKVGGQALSGKFLILIIASASADASGDKSAAKYSEISAILGV